MNRSWTLPLAILLTVAATVIFYQIFGRTKPYENLVPPQSVGARTDESQLESCLVGCQQNDKRLVKLIKENFLHPPSDLPYNFEETPPILTGQIGQPQMVDKLLKEKRTGFFLDCGANSGERFSNSLFFEMERNWTGLLVEPNPEVFQRLTQKNRKAYTLNTCLSMEETSGKVDFLLADMVGGIEGLPEIPYIHDFRKNYGGAKTVVQCFPLYSVLLALGNPVIDYFSLDVEGAEMAILRTIPWDKVKIRVLTVEYAAVEEVKREMIIFMASKGYYMLQEINVQDLLFIHKDSYL